MAECLLIVKQLLSSEIWVTLGMPMQISRLDQDVSWSRALDGNEYMPGLLGLNNMKHNDYVNVAVQILSRVAPVRDLFLQPSNFNDSMSPLTIRFGELLRKMWNPRNFKGQVGPDVFRLFTSMQKAAAENGFIPLRHPIQLIFKGMDFAQSMLLLGTADGIQ